MGGHELVPAMDAYCHELPTLEQLQSTMATFSGYLSKLAASPDSDGTRWKHRFFVLSEDLRLYIFKSGNNTTSHPISYLPISDCTGFFSSEEGTWLLKIHGDGLSADGTNVVKRTWTLRCNDEQTMQLWLRRINQIASSNYKDVQDQQHGGWRDEDHAMGTPADLPRIGSFTSLHSEGARSTASVDREFQMKAKYQEYLAIQMENAEKLRHWREMEQAEAAERAAAAAAAERAEDSKSLRGQLVFAAMPLGPIGSRGGPSHEAVKSPVVLRRASAVVTSRGSRGGPRIS
ncbi:hypothetical protein HDU81_006359 [Chytriomyces hyalinus]|nr:hypothetical protein HDU81_006359 [Chytriomyces hyalinus]